MTRGMQQVVEEVEEVVGRPRRRLGSGLARFCDDGFLMCQEQWTGQAMWDVGCGMSNMASSFSSVCIIFSALPLIVGRRLLLHSRAWSALGGLVAACKVAVQRMIGLDWLCRRGP